MVLKKALGQAASEDRDAGRHRSELFDNRNIDDTFIDNAVSIGRANNNSVLADKALVRRVVPYRGDYFCAGALLIFALTIGERKFAQAFHLAMLRGFADADLRHCFGGAIWIEAEGGTQFGALTARNSDVLLISLQAIGTSGRATSQHRTDRHRGGYRQNKCFFH